MRISPILAAVATGVLAAGGCSDGSGDSSDTGASADPRTEGHPSVAATSEDRPPGGKTPEETLRILVKRIADEDGDGACRLFLPGGAALFAHNFQAPHVRPRWTSSSAR